MGRCGRRFHGLLVADNGELEYQSLCQECAEDIKQVRRSTALPTLQ